MSQQPGDQFHKLLVSYITSWNEEIDILTEVNVGCRFIGTPRRLDIVLHNRKNHKFLGIECKVQISGGSADEKLTYAIEDCKTSPIPTIIVFGGDYIRNDMKSQMIASGIGLEATIETESHTTFKNDKKVNELSIKSITDTNGLIKQRCFIELGLNWLPFATGQHIEEQLIGIGIEPDKSIFRAQGHVSSTANNKKEHNDE